MKRELESGKKLKMFFDDRLPGALALLVLMLICSAIALAMGPRRFIKTLGMAGVHALTLTQQPYPVGGGFCEIVEHLERATDG
ncbi:MAG: hypothetical protein C5B55_01365 [Blastocatellia bacterium]|nr:MAG: hypothetical protein C5B55_01365 [Blastocatellia bacterium]